MGFFYSANKPERQSRTKSSSKLLLNRAGCSLCPLNDAKCKNPKMKPEGPPDQGGLYLLSSHPNKAADRVGRHVSPEVFSLLARYAPRKLLKGARWNAVIRTSPGDRDPTESEIECCRNYIVADIEKTKPAMIIGLGEIPLQWVLGMRTVAKWAGRLIPVKIGNHKCWFFPIADPSYILMQRRWEPRHRNEWGSEDEFRFNLDLKRAVKLYEDGLPEPILHTPEDALRDLILIDGSGGEADLAKLRKLFRSSADAAYAGVDLETVGTRPYALGNRILTAAISTKKETFAFALLHQYAKWTQPQVDEIVQLFTDWLLNSRNAKISHHLSFELEWLGYNFGKEIIRASKWEDTVTQAWVLDERMKMGKPDALSLEFLTIQYFGLNLKSLNQLDPNSLNEAPVIDVLQYNAMDARYHRLLFLAQRTRVKAEKLTRVYRHMNSRVPTVVLTQLMGLPIKQKIVEKLASRYGDAAAETEKLIMKLPAVKQYQRRFGKAFNPGSNHDLLKLLRQVLHKHVENTDAAALNSIKHEIGPLIIKLRDNTKMLSTYVTPVRKGSPILYPDGRIHPQIATTRTQTSRTSSEDPNSQNWPKHGAGKIVRSQIACAPDEVIVSFDYGQIQARNIAMESRDKAFVKSFWDRYDIHTEWAERTIRLYPDWAEEGAKAVARDKAILKKYRQRTKNEYVFPSFFGAQPKSISASMGVPIEIVEQMQEELWDQFPHIKEWQEELMEMYRKYGYVEGLSGVRRRAPISPNQLINAPIQADEALIVCDAMTRLSKKGVQASMEIHDDLTFIWKKKEVDTFAPIVISEMLNVPFDWVNVPILVEMAVGKDWASLQDVEDFSSDTWDKKFKWGGRGLPDAAK